MTDPIEREAAIAAVNDCSDSHSERWSVAERCDKACSCHAIFAAIRAIPAARVGGGELEFENALDEFARVIAAQEAIPIDASNERWRKSDERIVEKRNAVLDLYRAAAPVAHTPGPFQAVGPTDLERAGGKPRWYVTRIPGCGDVPPEKFFICIQSTGDEAKDKADAHFIADACNAYYAAPVALKSETSDEDAVARAAACIRINIDYWEQKITQDPDEAYLFARQILTAARKEGR